MKLSDRAVPISDLIADADDLIRSIGEHKQPVVITVDGERKAVLQDFESYEQTREAIAMLKALILTDQQVKEGEAEPLDEAFRQIREAARKG